MKHTHWSFKASTETFDGKRAVKEAYAAGMQIVTFETETTSQTFTTDEMYEKLADASVAFTFIDHLTDEQRFYPLLDVEGVCGSRSRDEDLPPFTVWIDADADAVREMIAKLKKPQRVAVSGYGPETGVDVAETLKGFAAAPGLFKWEGPGVYQRRDGTQSFLGERHGVSTYDGDYPLRDEYGETFTWRGCEYADEEHPRDFVGGKVGER